MRFERAQIGNGACDREGQFLRLRAAGIVNDAAVGDGEWPAKSCAREFGDEARKCPGKTAPRLRVAAGHRKAADRIEADAHIDRRRRDAAAFHQRGEVADDVAGLRADVEIDGDAGIEIDAVEHAGERFGRAADAIAVGVERSGADERQPGRAVFEIVQRQRIGRRGIGMIDALHDRPRLPRGAARDRYCAGSAGVKWVDGQAVIGPGDQPLLEWRAFEHAIHQLAPLLLRGRWKFGGQRQFIEGIGHGHKMPPRRFRCKRRANRRISSGAAAAARCRSCRCAPAPR